VGKLDISAGIRWNTFRIKVKEETLGESVITPQALVGNLAMGYTFHPQHRVSFSVNNTFRSPNIDDLGTLGIVDFRYEVPSQDLKPEKSVNYEFAYKMRLKKLSFGVIAYRNELHDLIDRVRSQYNGQDVVNEIPVYRKENVAQAYIQGLESDFEYALSPQIKLLGNITYTFGQNISKNEPMRRIPPLFAKLGLCYATKFGLKTSLEWLWADKQDRLAKGDTEDNRIPIGGTPSWNVWNFQANYQLRWLKINLVAQNIFDEAYKTHDSGVSGVGRSFWMGVRVDF
jgi:hemoglobin/transferrin/lactoferrin receptor protein